jgi:predicted metal-dependent enzyme (double-stranded beta helix superfamily)
MLLQDTSLQQDRQTQPTILQRLENSFYDLSNPKPDELQCLIQELNPTLDELRCYLKSPGKEAYSKTTLYSCDRAVPRLRRDRIECSVINWHHNLPCAIHDHGEHSWGLVKVINGELINTTYNRDADGALQEVSKTNHTQGELIYLPKGIIHQMVSIGQKHLVTFHCYCPTIQRMRVYDTALNAVCTITGDRSASIPKDCREIVSFDRITF